MLSAVNLLTRSLHSWFQNYEQPVCLAAEHCQDRLVETAFSQGIWLYDLATKGVQEVVSPQGGFAVPQQNNQNGFLTAVAAWLPLALTGADIGGVNSSPTASCPDSPTATVSIIPIPSCTALAPQATFTITAECADAIGALQTIPATNQNINCQVNITPTVNDVYTAAKVQ